jgi:hypothetical protein
MLFILSRTCNGTYLNQERKLCGVQALFDFEFIRAVADGQWHCVFVFGDFGHSGHLCREAAKMTL